MTTLLMEKPVETEQEEPVCRDCGGELSEEDLECRLYTEEEGGGYVCESCYGHYNYCAICKRDWHDEDPSACNHILMTEWGLYGPGSAEVIQGPQAHKENVLAVFDMTENPEQWMAPEEKRPPHWECQPLRLPERLLFMLSGWMRPYFYEYYGVGARIRSQMFSQDIEWQLPLLPPENMSSWGPNPDHVVEDFSARDFVTDMFYALSERRDWTLYEIGFAWLHGLDWEKTKDAIELTKTWCREWLDKQKESAASGDN